MKKIDSRKLSEAKTNLVFIRAWIDTKIRVVGDLQDRMEDCRGQTLIDAINDIQMLKDDLEEFDSSMESNIE
jgi:hypothetical protein